MLKRGVRCTRVSNKNKLKLDLLFKDKITLSVFLIVAIFVIGLLYLNSFNSESQEFSLGTLFTGAAVSAPIDVGIDPILEENNVTEVITEEEIIKEPTKQEEKSPAPLAIEAVPDEPPLTIQSPPVIGYARLNSSSGTNYTDEDLFVSTNKDSDPTLKLIYNWYVNNNSLMVLNLPFDGGSNNTYTRDYSFYNHTIEFDNDSPTWNESAGYDNFGAYYFYGEERGRSYLYVNESQFENITRGTFTAMMWVKKDTSVANAVLLSQRDTNGRTWLGSDSSGLSGCSNYSFYSNLGNVTNYVCGGNSSTTGVWNHLAVTYNGYKLILYVNGTEVDSDTRTVDEGASGDFFIGAHKSVLTGLFDAYGYKGHIDDVMIFNRSLSADQIETYFDNNRKRFVSNETQIFEIWQATVTPNNGSEDGVTNWTNTLYIRNSLPTFDNATLGSSYNDYFVTSENLTVTPINGSDYEDNTSIKFIYEWFVDNESLTELHLPFDGGSNDTYCKDYSNNSNHGRVVGAEFDRDGGYDGFGAYVFDNDDSKYINISDSSLAFNLSDPDVTGFSVEARFTSVDDVIDDKETLLVVGSSRIQPSSTNSSYSLYRNDASKNIIFHIANGSEVIVIDSLASINDSLWHHAVAVVDKPNSKIWFYVDGSLAANSSLNISGMIGYSLENKAFIGRNSLASPYSVPWNGSIDEVRIWNRPLSAQQVQALYENKTNTTTSDNTDRGETWYVNVTINDGYNDGDSKLSQTEIINRLPTQDAPILNTSSLTNTSNENLTAWGQNIDDLDMTTDPCLITNWYINGSSITDLYLAFQGNSTQGTTPDYSGNDFDGTVNSAVWELLIDDTDLDCLGGFNFNSVSSYVSVTSAAANFSTDTNFTICTFLKSEKTGINATIVSKLASTKGYQMFIEDDNRISGKVYMSGSNYTFAYSNQTVSSGSYYHICFTFNNTLNGSEIYINGDKATNKSAYSSQGSMQDYSANVAMRIGYNQAGGKPFNGTIYDIAFYNRKLSEEQIKALYDYIAVQNFTGPTTLVSQETQTGEVWNATVTITDGKEDGAINWSNSLTILAGAVCTDNDGDGFGVCPNCNITNGCTHDGNDCDDTNSSVLPPYDNLLINNNTILCSGTYNINDTSEDGIIRFNDADVSLDCNGTIINGTGIGTSIRTMNRNNVIIKNCNLSNYNTGITVGSNSVGVLIEDNNISASSDAINVSGNGTVIDDNNLYGGDLNLLSSCTNTNITNNYISNQFISDGANNSYIYNNNGDYFELSNGYNNQIIDNNLSTSLYIDNEENLTVINNDVGFVGSNSIVLLNSYEIYLFNNSAVKTILLSSTNNSEIISNNVTITSYEDGIALGSSSFNNITDNIINNGYITLSSSSTGNIFRNNEINTTDPSNDKLSVSSSADNNFIYNNSDGEINWYLNASGTSNSSLKLSVNPIISNNFVEFTPTFPTDILNISNATITLNNVVGLIAPEVLHDGQPCESNVCSAVTDLGGDSYQFNVTQFSNYSLRNSTKANLSLWDDNDPEGGNLNKSAGEQIGFYANYTKFAGGDAINNTFGNCNISFNETPNGPFVMTYNITSYLWDYNRSFAAAETATWNVSCYSTTYQDKNLSTTLTFGNQPPTVSSPVLSSDDTLNRTIANLSASWTYSDPESDPATINQTKWYNNSVEQTDLENLTFVAFGNTTKGEVWHFGVRAFDGTAWSNWINSSNITILNSDPYFEQSLTDQSVDSNQNFTYKINCSDFDTGDSLFYYDNTSLFDINLTTGLINDTPNGSDIGTYSINITCGDGTINVSDTFLYTVNDADVPIFSNAINTSLNFRRYENFTANITITNNDLDTYRFFTNASGSWLNISKYISGTEHNATEQANITLTKNNQICWYYWANDTSGNSASSNTYCFTVQNTPPTTPVISLSPASPNTTSNLNCSVTTVSTDLDTDTVNYYYLWYNNSVLAQSYGPTTDLSHILGYGNTTKGETWNCTVVPYDGEVNGSNVSTGVTIGNIAPTVSSPVLSSDDTLNRTIGNLSASWTFSDPDNDPATINHTKWYNNSIEQTDLENLTFIAFGNTTKGEVWHFSVRAFDGTAWSDWVNSSNITIQNSDPYFEQSLTEQNVSLGFNLTYDINCSDYDSSDTLNYYDNTTLFDINVTSGYINDTPSASDLGSHSINITCDDGTTNVSDTFIYNVIDDEGPILVNAINSSPNFRRYENFTANITINDSVALDNYIFSTNASGSWVNLTKDISGTEHNATEQANITLTKNNQICWYYWANDTSGNSASSNTYCFTVQNTPPTTPVISLSPASPESTDDIVCNITTNATDLDNDEVNYTFLWYKDGTFNLSSGITSNTSDTIDSSLTSATEVWECTVVPYDGEVNGTNVSDSVTVSTPAEVSAPGGGGGGLDQLKSTTEGTCKDSLTKFTVNRKGSTSKIYQVDVYIKDSKGNLITTLITNNEGVAQYTFTEVGVYNLLFDKSGFYDLEETITIEDCELMECDLDTDCAFDEYCFEGGCQKLDCENIVDHRCVEVDGDGYYMFDEIDECVEITKNGNSFTMFNKCDKILRVKAEDNGVIDTELKDKIKDKLMLLGYSDEDAELRAMEIALHDAYDSNLGFGRWSSLLMFGPKFLYPSDGLTRAGPLKTTTEMFHNGEKHNFDDYIIVHPGNTAEYGIESIGVAPVDGTVGIMFENQLVDDLIFTVIPEELIDIYVEVYETEQFIDIHAILARIKDENSVPEVEGVNDYDEFLIELSIDSDAESIELLMPKKTIFEFLNNNERVTLYTESLGPYYLYNDETKLITQQLIYDQDLANEYCVNNNCQIIAKVIRDGEVVKTKYVDFDVSIS